MQFNQNFSKRGYLLKGVMMINNCDVPLLRIPSDTFPLVISVFSARGSASLLEQENQWCNNVLYMGHHLHEQGGVFDHNLL